MRKTLRVVSTQPADDPLAPLRVSYLVDALGGATQLARIIGVNRSQPSRWISGEERPGGRAAPLIIDLEHVISRARLVWGEQAAATWLESASSYLGGARPLDVLLSEGPGRALDALDAVAAGSFS
ncbi:MAG: antitoxin Xre/MbcA/ParS toxin-binding domain-containing protein [Mycobacterium sp.]